MRGISAVMLYLTLLSALGLAAPFGTVKQAGGFLFAASAERGNLFRIYLPPAPGSGAP